MTCDQPPPAASPVQQALSCREHTALCVLRTDSGVMPHLPAKVRKPLFTHIYACTLLFLALSWHLLIFIFQLLDVLPLRSHQVPRSAAALLCRHLFLPGPPIHLVWSACSAVMKAMSWQVHSAWSVQIQASGTPHLQTAQVCTLYLIYIMIPTSSIHGLELRSPLSICDGSKLLLFPPTAVRCPQLEAPENSHVNCSNSDPVFNSQCSFTCNQDFSLDGHDLLTCDRNGNWTGETPTCKGKTGTNVKRNVNVISI